MAEGTTYIDPPFVISGTVKSYEASGGSPTSCLFSFHVSDGTREGNFQLRAETPAPMFAAMSMAVTVAFAIWTAIQVTSYEEHEAGHYLVNLIRGS